MIVTASGKLSAQWELYANYLLAERILSRHGDTYTSPAMERGVILEQAAGNWYEFSTGLEAKPVGFITTDDGKIGCSPDRLVGDDGLVEIKCPMPAAQIGYLLTGKVSRTYKPQIQGQLWVSDRQWVDVLAYSAEHPEIPHYIVRVERDMDYIAKLEAEVRNFVDNLDRAMDTITRVRMGTPTPPPLAKAVLRDMLAASLKKDGESPAAAKPTNWS